MVRRTVLPVNFSKHSSLGLCRAFLKPSGRGTSLLNKVSKLRHPHEIHISHDVCRAHAFAVICQAHDDNPYLPKIYDHFMLNQNTYVTVTEPLTKLQDMEDSKKTAMSGPVRAIASFARVDHYPDGEDHEEAHETLRGEESLVKAVRLLSDYALQSLKNGTKQCLLFDCQNEHILFRKDKAGNLISPVLFNPLSVVDVTPGIKEKIRKQSEAFPLSPAEQYARRREVNRNRALGF